LFKQYYNVYEAFIDKLNSIFLNSLKYSDYQN